MDFDKFHKFKIWLEITLERVLDFFEEMTALQFIILACALYGTVHMGWIWTKHSKQNRAYASMAIAGVPGVSGTPASCAGKKKCMVVYIAPWCGVCTQSQPTFHAFHKHLPKLRPDMGFGIVVGAASAADNAKKRDELKPIETFTDDDGSVMKARSIRSFPTWVVTDDKGKQLFKQAGGFNVTSEPMVEAALKQFFNM